MGGFGTGMSGCVSLLGDAAKSICGACERVGYGHTKPKRGIRDGRKSGREGTPARGKVPGWGCRKDAGWPGQGWRWLGWAAGRAHAGQRSTGQAGRHGQRCAIRSAARIRLCACNYSGK